MSVSRGTTYTGAEGRLLSGHQLRASVVLLVSRWRFVFVAKPSLPAAVGYKLTSALRLLLYRAHKTTATEC